MPTDPIQEIEGLFAFWSHSDFPYVIGGTVTRMDGQGRVETKEYGRGSWFRPLKLLPVAAGAALSAALKKLHHDHAKALANFDVEWVDKVRETCGDDLSEHLPSRKR